MQNSWNFIWCLVISHHKTIKLDNIHKTTEEIQCSYSTCGKNQVFQKNSGEVLQTEKVLTLVSLQYNKYWFNEQWNSHITSYKAILPGQKYSGTDPK